MSKAFNTIRIKYTIEIIDKYDISNSIKLMNSTYLQNRKILVENEKSLEYNIGIPENSTVGFRFLLRLKITAQTSKY